MELSQLKYFLAVSNCGQIASAATMLYVSPSAISMSISKLEKELGILLFERKNKCLKLTKSGMEFRSMIEPAIAALDNAKEAVIRSNLQEPEMITLSVELPDFATGLEQRFYAENPNARFRQTMDVSGMVLYKLQNRLVDYALTFLPINYPGIVSEQIYSEPVYLQVSRQNPLYDRHVIRLEDLKNIGFVSFSPDYGFRQWHNRLCLQAGFEPDVVFEVCDTQSMYQIVCETATAALVGKSSWEKFKANASRFDRTAIRVIPIENENCVRDIYLSYNTGRTLGHQAESFLAFAKHALGLLQLESTVSA